LPPGVVLALPAPASALVLRGVLSSNLARWFADTELKLPTLAERAEDLRALALDAVARACLALGREPKGLDALGLRMIVEHPRPGNELELHATLGRATALAEGPTLTGKDLIASGFSCEAPADLDALPASSPTRRRASRRPPRGR
jgi:DNA-binding NtrC family response regulator